MRRLAIALALISISTAACGGGSVDRVGSLRVAASIPPHGWLVGEVGGGAVEVVTILGPGDSPATFQPPDGAVSRVMSSRVLFTAGVPFEGGAWLEAIAGRLEVVRLDEGIADRVFGAADHASDGPDDGHGHRPGTVDPHAWLSPRRLIVQAARVAATLARLDPGNAREYATNLERLTGELAEVDRRCASLLAPFRGRELVVFHPAWGYFADDYDLVQVAIEIDGKEPSDADLTAIQERARQAGVGVVYVQPQIAGRSARAVATAIGARLETLDPLAPDVAANLQRTAETIAGGLDG
ncbi:MAG: zinc ABC transporter substrate-binding protein [Thermoanaerobaculales bacterium]|jgi:zinc transport system substrate-binding protein|nr:zinc ABC transporter substrate-binding protein [Thermoanaerobaculales bacterium]